MAFPRNTEKRIFLRYFESAIFDQHSIVFNTVENFDQAAAHIQHLIATNSDSVDFGDFGTWTSPEWLAKAQTRLHVVFPASYCWWLQHYGGGQIHGDEVFSIYELDFDQVVGGDVVYMNELARANDHWPMEHLLIMHTDQAQDFYLDLTPNSGTAEPPVYVSQGKNTRQYAANFFAFLEKQISDTYLTF